MYVHTWFQAEDHSGDKTTKDQDSEEEQSSDSTEGMDTQITNGASKESSSETDDKNSCDHSETSSSIDLDSFLGPEIHKPPSFTFKIVGDNIDKHIKPRDMRSDYQARSLHYFHSYAVQDWLNMDDFDDNIPCPDPGAVSLELLLPTPQDEANIRNNTCILVARILKKYMPFFTKYGKGVERHIIHQYSEEMSRTSHVVRIV